MAYPGGPQPGPRCQGVERSEPGPLRPGCQEGGCEPRVGEPLESCTPGTRQYKVVRTGTYQYILFWIEGGTRKGKIVHTSTDKSVLIYAISISVHTGMYWYVLYGTRRYKEVQGGTTKYKQWYKE